MDSLHTKAIIDLTTARVVPSTGGDTFSIITELRTWEFKAPSLMEKDEWVKALMYQKRVKTLGRKAASTFAFRGETVRILMLMISSK
jgi:hypothetical protein